MCFHGPAQLYDPAQIKEEILPVLIHADSDKISKFDLRNIVHDVFIVPVKVCQHT
jgi:hypothetical protein